MMEFGFVYGRFFFFFYSFILFHRVCNDLMDLDFFGKSVWQLC